MIVIYKFRNSILNNCIITWQHYYIWDLLSEQVWSLSIRQYEQ